MKPDICKHWNGIGLGDDHAMCNVGVDVKKLGEFHRPGMLNRLPCTGLGGRQGETLAECALADYPTAEEVAANEKSDTEFFRLVWPVLREIKANSKPGDVGTRNCPKCDCTLHWRRHPRNGHLHVGCTTADCVQIME